MINHFIRWSLRMSCYVGKNMLLFQAERVFEKAARDFMAATLKAARRLRPQGKWGYYSFPLCFNFSPHNPRAKCKPSAMKENDRWIDFLLFLVFTFQNSSAMFESCNLRHCWYFGQSPETLQLVKAAFRLKIFEWLKGRFCENFERTRTWCE